MVVMGSDDSCSMTVPSVEASCACLDDDAKKIKRVNSA